MPQRQFLKTWVTNLVDGIDAHLDEPTKMALVEACGRACAQRGPVESVKECHGDLDKPVSTSEKWTGKGNARRDAN